ncbi:MAG: hypothetical protein AAF215_07705 [Cyanobacteria bacterium P01_A01_bin.123]
MVIFQSHFLEERVIKLEEDFKEKFEFISNLIDDLETTLRHTVEQLKPQELTSRAALLEEYNRLLKYKDRLKGIDANVQASEEASNWLDRNRKQLVNYAKLEILDDKYKARKISKHTVQLFCQDLDFYLRWAGHYLRLASPPKDMPKGVIALVMPSQIYIEAFKFIRNEKISTTVGLSGRAVVMLRSFINRFLIKRDLELDATAYE